jgi:tape measure domain-containing protein
MPSVDDKVVSMSFESSKFESGVNSAIRAIEKLNQALTFKNAGKGLDDINAAGKRIDLSHIGAGVDEVSGKLNALRLTAIGVLSNIASKAIAAGTNFAKSFTFEPIKAGFAEYATNLNSIQTILANTQASGATLKDVNSALQELNKYSDKTIYNFSEMAKNIGTFTAAGVGLKPATSAIKGIANLAALSGSNSQQASTAMYQLSQAIAAGRVSLQDWNSVVNAGMGGTVFQRALAQTAVSMGTLKDSSLKLVGPMKNVSINGEAFRQSISAKPGEKSWLTSDVLTKTLSHFTGDLTDAQLKAEGFNAAQIKAIQQTAKTAQAAATQVKTLGQVFDVAKETAGSGWAQTFQIIFGDFNEAKKTFTALSNTINGFINTNAQARNKVLADWKELGGRTILIDSIKDAFHSLTTILHFVSLAFHDVFPPATGKDLLNLTKQFHNLVDALTPSQGTLVAIRRIFVGIFAALDIGIQIVKGIGLVFKDLFGTMSDGSGGFLSFLGDIGEMIKRFDDALKKGDGLEKFFHGIADVIAIPIKALQQFGSALHLVITGMNPFTSGMDDMTASMSPFEKVTNAVSNAWGKFLDSLLSSKSVLQPIFEAYINFFRTLIPAISNAISQMNFETVFAAIRTGLFAGLLLMLKNFFGKGSFVDQLSMLGGGLFKNISSAFGGLAGALKGVQGVLSAYQQNLKAEALRNIAIAIGILALSLVALSFIDPKRLNSALAGMTFAFGELLGAMAILDKIGTSGGFIKMPFIAGSMILLAGAIDVLSIAVIALSKLSWNDLLKGLTGVAGILGSLVVAVKPLAANSKGMITAGFGLMEIAVAMRILASAVAAFGGMNLGQLAKGLGSIAISLGTFVAAMRKMPTAGMMATGAAFILIAAGMKIMASAVAQFGSMNLETLGKGMAAVAASLIIMAYAMKLMPKTSVLQAAGLVAVAYALGLIADAVQQMGGLSIAQIAKGLVTLSIALGVLIIAMFAMEEAIPGAIAMGIVAAGVALLAPALVALGAQSWGSILKGLITLAGALVILGAAGALLTPVIPSLIGLGVALTLIGAGLALAGAGVALIGIGLAAIAASGAAAVAVLIGALESLAEKIPEVATKTLLGLLQVVESLAKVAPQFVDAIVQIVTSMLDAVIKLIPKLEQVFNLLIAAGVRILKANEGKLIQAGFDLLIALLNGIKNNIGEIVTSVIGIITSFVNALSTNATKLLSSGLKLLTSLLKGISDNFSLIADSVGDIVTKFITTLGTQYTRIVTAGLNVLTKFLEGIASNLGKVIKAAVDVVVAFITGVGNAGDRIVTAAVQAMIKFINTLEAQSEQLVNAGFQAILKFINAMTAAVNTYAPQLRTAGLQLGYALIDGMTAGLLSKAQSLYNTLSGIVSKAKSLVSGVKGFITHSPSKWTEEVGKNIILGLSGGLDSNAPLVYSSATAMTSGVINAVETLFGISSPSTVMYQIGQFVGQGFAEGLRGSSDDIQSAFTDLNTKLQDAIHSAHDVIVSENQKLADAHKEEADKIKAINDKKYKDEKDRVAAIAAVHEEYANTVSKINKTIEEQQAISKRAQATHSVLVKNLQDEKSQLMKLADEYAGVHDRLKQAKDDLTALKTKLQDQYGALPEIPDTMVTEIADAKKKIADANTKLNEAVSAEVPDTQAVADAQAAVVDAQAQFDSLVAGKVLNAEGTAVDQLATYVQALKTQTDTVSAYQATLQQLRKLGLDDATYQKLLDEGPADQRFAEQLLSGGQQAVGELDKLDTNLSTTADRLATNAGNNLFKVGVQGKEGLITGLESDEADLLKRMGKLGKKILNAIKKSLGIKSPSTEFAEIGRDSMEGLAKGFSDSTTIVADAVDSAAKDALTAMRQSMKGLSDGLAEHIDPNPVITPILDLTQVRSQAQELSGLTNTVPITASASYGHATSISASTPTTQGEDVPVPGVTSVKFEQNNYSPESLSDIEIYRQTKNQLSQLRTALNLT